MKLPTKAAIIALLGDFTFLLTILAALPYELGDVAQFITPDLKATVVKLGIFATVGLKLVQRIVERLQGNRDAANIAFAATTMRGLPGSTLAVLVLCAFFVTGCAMRRPVKVDPKKVKAPSAYGFSFGLRYGNAGGASVTRADGRTTFGVDVDAKQVVRVLNN